MTPPMPTNETPSAGAVARAEEIVNAWCDYPGLADSIGPSLDGIGAVSALQAAIALALDAFARGREAAVWEEAAKSLDNLAARYEKEHAPMAGEDDCMVKAEVLREVAGEMRLRTRAAEARKTG